MRPVLADGTGLLLNPRRTAFGSQTATVVGPDGQATPNRAGEIYTDKLGRIRIRFHWQEDSQDGAEAASTSSTSTAWVRVLQRSAGGGSGAGRGLQFIPRIGQEVTSGAWAWQMATAPGPTDVSLRIPEEIPTLHLVAAHEVRRSFPLDSVSVGAGMPARCEELVFPGVHSDVGGAYAPTEQGKGLDPTGADMLSRIPLVYALARAGYLRYRKVYAGGDTVLLSSVPGQDIAESQTT